MRKSTPDKTHDGRTRFARAAFPLLRRLIVAVALALWLIGPIMGMQSATASVPAVHGSAMMAAMQRMDGAASSVMGTCFQKEGCRGNTGDMDRMLAGCLQFCFTHCYLPGSPPLAAGDWPAPGKAVATGTPPWHSISTEPVVPPPRILS